MSFLDEILSSALISAGCIRSRQETGVFCLSIFYLTSSSWYLTYVLDFDIHFASCEGKQFAGSQTEQ